MIIQEGIFYDGNDIAWKRDVAEAKQVFNNNKKHSKYLIF